MLPPSPGGVPEDPGAVVTVVPVVDRTRFLIRQDRRLLSLLAVACVLLVWEGVTRAGLVQSLFLPRPSAILAEGWAMIRTGELWGHLGTSLGRILMGMAVGASLGVVVGVLTGFSDVAEAVGSPLVAAAYPIPKIALLPLLILWFGIGEASKVAVIGLGTFFPLAINTHTGVRSTDPGLIRAAVAFGAGRTSIVRKVVLPSALPMIFAGLRLAAGTSLLLLVASEMIGADRGLGFLILHAANLMLTTQLMVGVLVLSILGLSFATVLRWLERRLIPWRDWTS